MNLIQRENLIYDDDIRSEESSDPVQKLSEENGKSKRIKGKFEENLNEKESERKGDILFDVRKMKRKYSEKHNSLENNDSTNREDIVIDEYEDGDDAEDSEDDKEDESDSFKDWLYESLEWQDLDEESDESDESKENSHKDL